MPTRNNVHGFIHKSMSSCRKLWVFMYSLFFILAWVSFYSTKGETQLVATSMYVAIGFVFYCLMLLVLPLIYFIDQAIKERVERVRLIVGTEIVNTSYKFLMTTIFPIFAIIMGRYVHDKPSLWTCVGFVGSLFCLLICYVNPADNGISDAFLGLWMGVVVNLERPVDKYIVLIIIGLLMHISKEILVHERNLAKEVQVLKTTHQKG